MTRNVVPVGYKLAGDDPDGTSARPLRLGTAMIRIDVRWDRGRWRKSSTEEPLIFGDRIIF